MSEESTVMSPESKAVLEKLYPDPVKRARMSRLFVEAVIALRACSEASDPGPDQISDPGELDGETTVIMFRSGPSSASAPRKAERRR